MAYFYDSKIVVSGRQAEIYRYKKRIWRDFVSKEREDKEPRQLSMMDKLKRKKKQKKDVVNRSRTRIRRLANANPQLNKFLTLTFADNISDLKDANYIFNKFALRIRSRYPYFQYLAVPEFQKRGAVHYHILCNLSFVDSNELKETWGQGFVKINRINKVNNVGAYMCKYLGKEMGEHAFGKKKFFKSQDLQEPTELMGKQADNFVERFIGEKEPELSRTFYSKWTGNVSYASYSLDTLPFPDGFDRNVVRTIRKN